MAAGSPARGGEDGWLGEPLEVRGGCMRFVLPPGTLVRVRRVGPGELRLGDLVVFLHAGGAAPSATSPAAVHRLVWRKPVGGGWRLWTKQDVSVRLDETTLSAGLIGKVASLSRGGARWIDLEEPAGAAWHRAVGLGSWLFAAVRPAARRCLDGSYRLACSRPAAGWRGLRAAIQRASLWCDG